MKIQYLTGVVLPERATLNTAPFGSQILAEDGTPYLSVRIDILANQISARVETDEPNIYTVRNLVRKEVELFTDIAGFLMGHAYDVEIRMAAGPDLESPIVFGIDIPVLAARATGRDLSGLASAILPLCYGLGAEHLRRCLTDLASAIKRPEDTAFYCFRALESLRHSFGAHLSESEQWKAMASAVNSNKEEMAELRDEALAARHGNHKSFTDASRAKHFSYTWSIVERYIDHRLETSGRERIFFPKVATERDEKVRGET